MITRSVVPLEECDPRMANLRAGISDTGDRIRAELSVIRERYEAGQYYDGDLGYNNLIFWDGA